MIEDGGGDGYHKLVVDAEREFVEYPFDASAASGGDAMEDATSSTIGVEPQVHMRVKVRFVDDYFYGEITRVDKESSNKTFVEIAYDDGSTERITYPDADVQLAMPGRC